MTNKPALPKWSTTELLQHQKAWDNAKADFVADNGFEPATFEEYSSVARRAEAIRKGLA